jgi:flavorubredoxin
MITNQGSGTAIDEVADGIYRIFTPVSAVPGGFSFNQYLIRDEEPLLFHTGLRKIFPLVREAIASVMPVEELRHIAFSHYEADECGALNEFLAVAPAATPLCGKIAAMVSIGDVADRAPRALEDGERFAIGKHKLRWLATPHLPHGWECGYLMEETTRTFFCGDLFTQGGAAHPATSESDIIEPSEAFRTQLDYFSHCRNAAPMIERLARLEPATLACMHGPAWRGDGAALLRALGARLAGTA